MDSNCASIVVRGNLVQYIVIAPEANEEARSGLVGLWQRALVRRPGLDGVCEGSSLPPSRLHSVGRPATHRSRRSAASSDIVWSFVICVELRDRYYVCAVASRGVCRCPVACSAQGAKR